MEESIELCKQRFQSEDFHVMDCSTQYLDSKYDLITCIDVIEHIDNDEQFFVNLCKMVKKDLLIVTLEGRMRKNEPPFGHFRNYKIGELEAMGQKSGLQVHKVIRWGFPFFSPLYRNFTENASIQNQAFGRYGLFKRIIAKIIYGIFCLNSHKTGDLVLIHYKKPS